MLPIFNEKSLPPSPGCPDRLIFDEPTASLDGATGRKIIGFIRERLSNEHRGMLIVTHDARIFEFGDRNLKMADGGIMEIVSGGMSGK
jgi:putative ABC transport system ATP-binding protein